MIRNTASKTTIQEVGMEDCFDYGGGVSTKIQFGGGSNNFN